MEMDSSSRSTTGVSASSSTRTVFGAMSSDFGYYYYFHNNSSSMEKAEKRQVFLRSYQFSTKRKSSMMERIKRTFIRAKRVILLRLRSTWKISRRLLCRFRMQLRSPRYCGGRGGGYFYGTRPGRSTRFHRLMVVR